MAIDTYVPVTLTRIPMATDVLFRYELEAKKRGIPVESLMAERLGEALTFNAQRGIYLDDEQRRRLEATLASNVKDGEEIVRRTAALSSVKVSGAYVQLKPQLIQRLKARALNIPFNKFIEDIVVKSLEQYVGLR